MTGEQLLPVEQACVVPDDEIRRRILDGARPLAPSLLRNGISQWCAAHGVQRSHVNEFINGKRRPTSDLLRALGLRWAIVEDAHHD